MRSVVLIKSIEFDGRLAHQFPQSPHVLPAERDSYTDQQKFLIAQLSTKVRRSCRLLRAAVLAVVPAAPMPVPAKIRSIDGNRHHMAHSWWNIAVTTGTQVRLVGLIRLNKPGLDFAEAFWVDHPKNIQMMRARNTMVAAPTNKKSVGRRFWGRLGSNPTT